MNVTNLFLHRFIDNAALQLHVVLWQVAYNTRIKTSVKAAGPYNRVRARPGPGGGPGLRAKVRAGSIYEAMFIAGVSRSAPGSKVGLWPVAEQRQ